MNNIKIGSIIGVAAAVALLVGIVSTALILSGGSSPLAGVNVEKEILTKGLWVGSPAVQVIDASANVTSTGSGTFGSLSLDGSTAIGEFSCTTATWNPPAMSSTTVASTSVALSGLALGDIVSANLNAATSSDQWYVTANVKNAGSSTVFLVPSTGSAAWNDGLNLTTSTLKVCYFGF